MKVIAIFEQFTYRITSLKGLEYKGEEIINGKQARDLLHKFINKVEEVYKNEKEFILYLSLEQVRELLGCELEWEFDINKIEITNDYILEQVKKWFVELLGL